MAGFLFSGREGINVNQFIAMSKELLADMETPVSAFMKLCGEERTAYLFESSETVESIGRYSIIAWGPLGGIRLFHDRIEIHDEAGVKTGNPSEFFDSSRAFLKSMSCAGLPDLPFVGSLVGYAGYDTVRLIERLPEAYLGEKALADLNLLSQFLIFDHHRRLMTLVAISKSTTDCMAMIRDSEDRLRTNAYNGFSRKTFSYDYPSKEVFMRSVETAKKHILDGDIFQVVLSGQFKGRGNLDPLDVYRWMRVKNPSPYMFYCANEDRKLVGASPETLVKIDGGTMYIRPIAGTRGRSKDPAVDRYLERELMGSEKEKAEHIMLVDLARNDAGRVCKYGTVKVDPYMTVERFSHVMHIVSQVEGTPNEKLDSWDVFKAAFPAGTVSGAPKVRAMEIISELEPAPRGPYAGAVGFWGTGQNMDTCIAIRMIEFAGDEFTLQAGAGIVADSIPEMEYEEILKKAAHGLAALKAAAGE